MTRLTIVANAIKQRKVLNMSTTDHKSDAAERVRSAAGYDISPLSDSEKTSLAEALTDEERRVILNQGTEPPFCGPLLDNKHEGIYACRLCGLPLFGAGEKFDSGTGWPSFTGPFDEGHIGCFHDDSHGMVRTEIRCRRCDGHLGHVFEDGPAPSRQRFCLNSVSLEFIPEGCELPRRVQADL